MKYFIFNSFVTEVIQSITYLFVCHHDQLVIS